MREDKSSLSCMGCVFYFSFHADSCDSVVCRIYRWLVVAVSKGKLAVFYRASKSSQSQFQCIDSEVGMPTLTLRAAKIHMYLTNNSSEAELDEGVLGMRFSELMHM
jgi:hypothetical protein